MGAPTPGHRPQPEPAPSGHAAGAEGHPGVRDVCLPHSGGLRGRLPPVELLAEERYLLYWHIKKLRERGEGPSARDLRALKTQAGDRILDKWSAELVDPRGFGRQTAEAVRPCLPEMVDRRRRGLSFHMVQVLTGHGCFGRYLHQIGKENTTECHHCSEPEDSARHTLVECEAWSQER
ncbi:uncharacterized protein LOC112589214 [Harpegnathos saltator]|uniref:uncharacterized protein LOC112589214 n=1 Tax=Harpegnathos saltator TaxID=610380 RepID=UPI000DBEF1C8|nr:uncharacterized protein LOC112589214 [Harpegnathos saltator]